MHVLHLLYASPQLVDELHLICVHLAGSSWNGTFAVDEFSQASPIDSGNCGQEIVRAVMNGDSSTGSIDSHSSNSNGNTGNNIGVARRGWGSNKLRGREAATANKPLTVLAYIASDNSASAEQIRDTLGHSNTFLAPSGCHIDYDPSPACSHTTLLYWFVLTMNDHSVYQSYLDGDSGVALPSSSFSRYAGSQQCSAPHAGAAWNATVSRLPQGNWVCTGGKIY